jgi:hypothetical protein
LEAYPEKNKQIDKIVLTFIPFDSVNAGMIKTKETEFYTDINSFNGSQYIIQGKSTYAGNFQELIKFKKSEDASGKSVGDSRITGQQILKNYLYLVDFCVHYGNSNGTKYIHEYRWLYTTG